MEIIPRLSTSLPEMATLPPPTLTATRRAIEYSQRKSPVGQSRTKMSGSFRANLNRRFTYRRLFLCHASFSPPPQSEPPPGGKDPIRLKGAASALTRFQDHVQIFLAVLFWMSLFFWASAGDGKNKGRPNKGSRFRR